jgi:hypothetical protein
MSAQLDARGGERGVAAAAVPRDVVEQQLHRPDLAHLRGDDLVGQLPHPRIADVGLAGVVDRDRGAGSSTS